MRYQTAIIQYQQPTNTEGGTLNTGSFQQIPYNTITSDLDSIITSLSGGRIKPIAGDYEYEICSVFYDIDEHTVRFSNYTDSLVLRAKSDDAAQLGKTIQRGTFTTDGTKEFEALVRPFTTETTYGLGVASLIAGEVEAYSWIMLRRIANTSDACPLAVLSYTEAQGVAAQTFGAGARVSYPTNTVSFDSTGFVTVTGPDFQLPAGRYEMVADLYPMDTDRGKVWIRDLTAPTDLALCNIHGATSLNARAPVMVPAVFDLSVTTDIEVQIQGSAPYTPRFGTTGFNLGPENYGQIRIRKYS